MEDESIDAIAQNLGIRPKKKRYLNTTETEPDELSWMSDLFSVYLMRCRADFRVGMTKLTFYSHSGKLEAGIIKRTTDEQADSSWILTVHYTAKECYLDELYIQTTFGIPGYPFKTRENELASSEEIWEVLGNNTKRAQICLERFHLDIHNPLYERGKPWRYGSVRRSLLAAPAISALKTE